MRFLFANKRRKGANLCEVLFHTLVDRYSFCFSFP